MRLVTLHRIRKKLFHGCWKSWQESPTYMLLNDFHTIHYRTLLLILIPTFWHLCNAHLNSVHAYNKRDPCRNELLKWVFWSPLFWYANDDMWKLAARKKKKRKGAWGEHSCVSQHSEYILPVYYGAETKNEEIAAKNETDFFPFINKSVNFLILLLVTNHAFK